MREGTKNFKGEFWVGQHVKVDTSWLPGNIKIYCDTGIIRNIKGKFLKSPDLAAINYEVWMDIDKWSNLHGEPMVIAKGENLTPIEEDEK